MNSDDRFFFIGNDNIALTTANGQWMTPHPPYGEYELNNLFDLILQVALVRPTPGILSGFLFKTGFHYRRNKGTKTTTRDFLRPQGYTKSSKTH
jgi:hypothetical protein